MEHQSNVLTLRQNWSWTACAAIAGIAVTVDVLLIQSPLVWLAAAGGLAVLAQFRSPLSGLAVVVFTCGLLNYSPFEAGAISRVYPGNVAIGIFLLAWLAGNFSRGNIFPSTVLNKPFRGLALLVPASMLWSRLHPDAEVTYAYPHSDVSWTTAQASQLVLLAATLCLPFAVAAAIKRWKDIEIVVMMVAGVAGIGTLLTAGGLIFGYGGSYAILGATRAYWGEPWDSSIEPLTALCLPFLFAAVLFGRRSVSNYRFLCVLFALCLVGLVLTFSRETWLLGLCGLLMVGAVWLRSRVNPAVALLVIVLGAVVVVLSGVIGVVSSFYNPDQVYGLERIYYYMTALQLFASHPLIGVGAGNYQFFDRSLEGKDAGGIAHNQFLTAAAETGLVGLGFLLWLVLALLKIRKQLRLQIEPGDPHNWIRIAGSAFLLMWIAECFFQEAFFATAAAGGGMHVMTTISFSWVFLGLLLAASQLSEQTSPIET